MEIKMWEIYPGIWNTEAKYMSWIRGGIRRGLWNKHPIKLEFLNENTFLVKNTNPRSMKRFPEVKKCKCNLCGDILSPSLIEVDHRSGGNYSLKNSRDIGPFIRSVIEVVKEDLQAICKPCHKNKSYADKQGITYKEATAIKKAIAIIKAKEDKEWLLSRNIEPMSSQAKRREQIIDELNKESGNGNKPI